MQQDGRVLSEGLSLADPLQSAVQFGRRGSAIPLVVFSDLAGPGLLQGGQGRPAFQKLAGPGAAQVSGQLQGLRIVTLQQLGELIAFG